jgi:hypothetical protein
MRRKKYFFGTIFAVANLAESLAQDLLWLPFWQAARGFCHLGSFTSAVVAGASRIYLGSLNKYLFTKSTIRERHNPIFSTTILTHDSVD